MDSMLSEPYMQRALLIAVLLAPLCGVLGVFVTARRMSFFSETVAHGSLAGVAIGLALGIDTAWPILGVSLAVALLVLWLRENTDLLTDTIMALLMSGFMAAGVVGFSKLRGFRGELHRYLFGDILSVGWPDVALAGIVGGFVMAFLITRLSPMALMTLSEDLAHVSGTSVRRLNLVFVVLLTLTVALSIRLLGIILVTSLLVIPPATARNVASTLRQELLLSLLCGLLSGIFGVVASYQFDLPCGPSIVLAAVGLFLMSLTARALRRLGRRSSHP
jgi:zinc transport system permease protein